MRRALLLLVLVTATAAPSFPQTRPSEWLDRYARAYTANPDNTFYEYATAQTAHRLGAENPTGAVRNARAGQWSRQLYEMTTGAWAVQESLQLDRIAGSGDLVDPATIPIATVEQIATPSIPFEKLMNGRTPVVEPLARVAPSDWYYAHFTKVASMRRLLGAAEHWGNHLLSAYEVTGRDARVRAKLEAQTLLHVSPELESLYDLVVGDAIIVGSDPFFEEGTDFTVVFTVKNELVFKTRLDLDRSNATAASSGVSIIHEPYRTWTIDGVANVDHSLSSYATIRNGIAIVSNSLPALRHVADVADGLTPSIADAPDFKYMRAVRPYSDSDEDAFLFLSDGFVRRVVGPELKIGEARRVRCIVSLQTLAYAELMFRTELGRPPNSIDELVEGRYLDGPSVQCPDGGTYSLDGGTPVCSVHGRQRFLKPNLETEIATVSHDEAEAYAAFRENYKNYWRRYIDPVGIRVRMRDAIDLDVTILPLVENSAYSSAVEAVGPEPVSLARPQIPDAVVTLDFKLPPSGKDSPFLRDIGEMFDVDPTALFGKALGDHASVQIADAAPIIDTDFAGAFGGGTSRAFDDWLFFSPLVASLTMPTAVVIPIRDRAALDAALTGVRSLTARAGTRHDEWFQLENYQLVQGGARTVEAVSVRFFVLRWRVYFSVVGEQFVLATDRSLIDAVANAPSSGASMGTVRLEVAPSRWKRLVPSLALAYAEDSRRACLSNVSWLDALRDAFGKSPNELDASALALFGAAFSCPDGGRYVVGPDGRVQCSQHGTRALPRQGPRPQPGSPAAFVLEGVRRIEATLTFTPDGLESHVRIE